MSHCLLNVFCNHIRYSYVTKLIVKRYWRSKYLSLLYVICYMAEWFHISGVQAINDCPYTLIWIHWALFLCEYTKHKVFYSIISKPTYCNPIVSCLCDSRGWRNIVFCWASKILMNFISQEHPVGLSSNVILGGSIGSRAEVDSLSSSKTMLHGRWKCKMNLN